MLLDPICPSEGGPKWRHHGDPGGWAPLGFTREPDPPRRIVIDPETIRVVGLFERYAIGTVSMLELQQETGIHEEAIREILHNPMYDGWVQRKEDAPRPAPWRLRARPGTDPRFSVLPPERVIRIPIAGHVEWERAGQETA